jgi:hypothetical protein
MAKHEENAGTDPKIWREPAAKTYQSITGNEGPSPLMKRYLKLLKEEQIVQPAGKRPD